MCITKSSKRDDLCRRGLYRYLGPWEPMEVGLKLKLDKYYGEWEYDAIEELLSTFRRLRGIGGTPKEFAKWLGRFQNEWKIQIVSR